MPDWSNWSGSVACEPRALLFPSSEAEVREAVRRAARERVGLRVTGTGHSFTPLCATDGLLLSLDSLQGVVEANPDRLEATLWAGTKIHQVGPLLHEYGLAMENMGDIDRQSIAGAMSTGTHGTGPGYGNIPTQANRIRVIRADGDPVEWTASEYPDHFLAARVSLGLLGVITQVTLRLRRSFRIQERTWRMPTEECMERLHELIAANDHFEFFWNPVADRAECKSLNPTDLEPGDVVEPYQRVGWSWEIIPSERNLRFNEMEYSVPAGYGPACFMAIRERMQTRWPEIQWPLEYRTLAADGALLSTAHARPTVTISVHQAADLPFREFFADIERIFLAHDGRPHWGKIHTRSADDLRSLYPRWGEFLEIRRRLDPGDRFLNPYLRELFV